MTLVNDIHLLGEFLWCVMSHFLNSSDVINTPIGGTVKLHNINALTSMNADTRPTFTAGPVATRLPVGACKKGGEYPCY